MDRVVSMYWYMVTSPWYCIIGPITMSLELDMLITLFGGGGSSFWAMCWSVNWSGLLSFLSTWSEMVSNRRVDLANWWVDGCDERQPSIVVVWGSNGLVILHHEVSAANTSRLLFSLLKRKTVEAVHYLQSSLLTLHRKIECNYSFKIY